MKPEERYPGEVGFAALFFRVIVAADVLALAVGWIIIQQPTPYGMDAGPGPGLAGLFLLVLAAPLGVVLLLIWLTIGHASRERIRILLCLVGAVAVITVVAKSGVWPPRNYSPPDLVSPIVAIDKQPDFSYRLTLAHGGYKDVSHGGFYQGSPTPGPSALVALGACQNSGSATC